MVIDDLLRNNEAYAGGFEKGDLPAEPSKRVAIVTCMDARIDVHRILALDEGDAHVIRNAGGLITDDALRSLVLSQRVLGTDHVMVIQHTRCGLLDLPEGDIKRDMERELGAAPDFPFGGFSDLHESVRAAVDTVKASPFLTGAAAGFVYDVTTGKLHAVE